MTKIEKIINSDESLYDFFKEKYRKYGTLPDLFLTESVLERLFIYEHIPDSLTGELFGLNNRQVARRRYKYNIKWKAPKYRKDKSMNWFDKKAVELKKNFTEDEINQMRETFANIIELEFY